MDPLIDNYSKYNQNLIQNLFVSAHVPNNRNNLFYKRNIIVEILDYFSQYKTENNTDQKYHRQNTVIYYFLGISAFYCQN
jgi:hypothetical protein